MGGKGAAVSRWRWVTSCIHLRIGHAAGGQDSWICQKTNVDECCRGCIVGLGESLQSLLFLSDVLVTLEPGWSRHKNGEIDTGIAFHHDDIIVLSMSGSCPVRGRWEGGFSAREL